MKFSAILGLLLLGITVAACGSKTPMSSGTAGTSSNGNGGSDSSSGGIDGSGGQSPLAGNAGKSAGAGATGDGTVTFWQDIAPILEQNCLQCHQTGGIAPFALDSYAQAKSVAARMRVQVESRTMPPWSVATDGTCGDFSGSLALSEEQIQTVGAWVDGGTQEGANPRPFVVPELPALAGTTNFSTPSFSPEIQGGDLAQFDEYRCFALDSGQSADSFITGYEVAPGTPAVIHHVLLMLVKPDAPSSIAGLSNLQQMKALDDQSPDRDGWPCFGMAGDGVEVDAVPVTWAPGQGIVRYPNHSGVPLSTSHKLVMQVHYNLVDPAQHGKTDLTTIKLRLEPTVENVGIFVLKDPLLGSLSRGARADVLPPAQASAKYTWKASIAELGLGTLPGLKLYGVMPHMHQLGHKYTLDVGSSGATPGCAADVENWDFHWQRMYFYATPYSVNGTSTVQVTCDYDTSSRNTPVLPGWGTQNEMCLATLYFTAPLSAFGH